MKPTREEEKELGQIADNLNDCGSKKGYRREYFYQELLRVYKMGYDQRKNKDNWRGPEERPEEYQLIVAYYYTDNRGTFRKGVGEFDKFSNTLHSSNHISWRDVLCWQPIDPGPMPERFKLKGETTK